MYRNKDYIKSLWKRTDGPLNVYINIPFCFCSCRYCLYKGKISPFTERENYIRNYLIPELESFQDILSSRETECVYIGGGTPNSVEFETLSPVFEMDFFKNAPVKIIENNPAFTDSAYIEKVADAGFTLITFGIQSFDESSLSYQNRPPVSSERIRNYIEICRKNKVHTSLDIMCYLKSYTKKDLPVFEADMEKAFALKPDFITVYPELNLVMKDEKAAEDFICKVREFKNPSYENITSEENNPRKIFRFLNRETGREEFYGKILPYYENDFPFAIQNIIGFGDYNSKQEVVSYSPAKFFYTEHYNNGLPVYNLKYEA